MTFNVTVRPYPAGAGTTVHDELFTIEGHCMACALDKFYTNSKVRMFYDPDEWKVVKISEVKE